MGKVSSRAFISLFLLAEVVVPYTATAYFEPLQVHDSFSYLKRIFERVTVSDTVTPGEETSGAELLQDEPGPSGLTVTVTAYSSSPDETDDDPFVTAAGTAVRDGVVATNMLPFGTKVRIPELFGEKVFVVEDRMHRRFSDRVDIWFPSKRGALQFGKKIAFIEFES